MNEAWLETETGARVAIIGLPVIGADIVEYNPRMDPQNATGVVCAKLLKEIAAKMLQNRER